jgi:hypothetical protein
MTSGWYDSGEKKGGIGLRFKMFVGVGGCGNNMSSNDMGGICAGEVGKQRV